MISKYFFLCVVKSCSLCDWNSVDLHNEYANFWPFSKLKQLSQVFLRLPFFIIQAAGVFVLSLEMLESVDENSSRYLIRRLSGPETLKWKAQKELLHMFDKVPNCIFY